MSDFLRFSFPEGMSPQAVAEALTGYLSVADARMELVHVGEDGREVRAPLRKTAGNDNHWRLDVGPVVEYFLLFRPDGSAELHCRFQSGEAPIKQAVELFCAEHPCERETAA